jgi:lipoprotein-releasing system ATP-binding protein
MESDGRNEAGVLLRAQGVHREFHLAGAGLHILRGVDLTLHEGEVMVILGSSGAGKSTLLHILGGLDRPTAGSVVFLGEDLFQLSETALARFRNRNLGFVFQFHHLLREFTAEENVMMPGLIRKQPRAEARIRARELLAEVGLLDRAEHKPDELSGGEQQRVALARSLFSQPRLVLADEPTGNLDPPTARTLHDLMYTLARRHRQAWIVVTHNEELAQLADTRTRLDDGVLVVQGRGGMGGPGTVSGAQAGGGIAAGSGAGSGFGLPDGFPGRSEG